WGRGERFFPAPHLAFFRAHLPEHAHIDEPLGFGHSPQLDDVDAFAQRIVDFTCEVRSSRIGMRSIPPAPAIEHAHTPRRRVARSARPYATRRSHDDESI